MIFLLFFGSIREYLGFGLLFLDSFWSPGFTRVDRFFFAGFCLFDLSFFVQNTRFKNTKNTNTSSIPMNK
jgi:hypothetical protein